MEEIHFVLVQKPFPFTFFTFTPGISWGISCTETDDSDCSPNGFCVHKNTAEAMYIGVKTDPQYM